MLIQLLLERVNTKLELILLKYLIVSLGIPVQCTAFMDKVVQLTFRWYFYVFFCQFMFDLQSCPYSILKHSMNFRLEFIT